MNLKNVDLKHLRAFVAVAGHQSFVAAAKVLCISQPALTQRVQQLEAQIGGRLLDRTTRRVHVTPLGENFLPHASHLLGHFDTLVSDMADLLARRSGRVVVACLASVAYRLMPLVISACKREYPGIAIIIRDANMRGVQASIQSGEADLAIGSHLENEPDLDATVLATDQFRLVCPRDHPLATKRVVRWQDLSGHPFIAMSSETGIRQYLDPELQRRGVHLNVIAEVSHLATVNGMLEEGIGISVLAGLMLPRDNHPTLTHRALAGVPLQRELTITWRRGTSFSPAASALLEMIALVLRNDENRRQWFHVTWTPDTWAKLNLTK
ncbi:MAG: LysR family transcriptional regulator [Proteobacteria bacterium]|nr:LysR family transcriptional regulator [Pseudomonadota bacterium]